MAHSRLSPKTLALVPQPLRGAAERPAPGIVHLGIGAFFRAQTALYTQEAIAAAGGDWGVIGVSLRSPQQRDLLAPQDFLYTAIERDAGGARATIVNILREILVAPENPARRPRTDGAARDADRDTHRHRERLLPRSRERHAQLGASGHQTRSRQSGRRRARPSALLSKRCDCEKKSRSRPSPPSPATTSRITENFWKAWCALSRNASIPRSANGSRRMRRFRAAWSTASFRPRPTRTSTTRRV